MNRSSLTETVVLGALSGMRSMSGPATLALRRGGVPAAAMLTLAAGEMVADKTSIVPDRIEPLPLAGRMAAGAIVGVVIAREGGDSLLLGGVIGAAAATVATHVAYAVRRRLAGSSIAGGVVEDLVVAATALMAARQHRGAAQP
jgi:uncharacterized membrane protein